MELLQAAIVALIGTGTPILATVGLMLLAGWGISKMPKSSNEGIRALGEMLAGLRRDVVAHDKRQDDMHAELLTLHRGTQKSVHELGEKVGVLSERVARHDGMMERFIKQ